MITSLVFDNEDVVTEDSEATCDGSMIVYTRWLWVMTAALAQSKNNTHHSRLFSLPAGLGLTEGEDVLCFQFHSDGDWENQTLANLYTQHYKYDEGQVWHAALTAARCTNSYRKSSISEDVKHAGEERRLYSQPHFDMLWNWQLSWEAVKRLFCSAI